MAAVESGRSRRKAADWPDVPTNVRHDNTLAQPLRDYGPRDHVDVIVTNPPFGGMGEDGIENNFPVNFRTNETADLFLVLIMHQLKDGGRAAVVLPDGTLFGEGIKTRIKEQLLATCQFSPKGRTADVWFYEHHYPLQRSFRRTRVAATDADDGADGVSALSNGVKLRRLLARMKAVEAHRRKPGLPCTVPCPMPSSRSRISPSVEHDLVLGAVLVQLRVADPGQFPLLVAEMGVEHPGQLFRGGPHLPDIRMLLPEFGDVRGEIEDFLVLRVDLRLVDLQVVAPGDQLPERRIGQSMQA